MTTAEIVSELEGIAARNPAEKNAIARIIDETREITKIALRVERALHDVIKLQEKGN